jgi:hypothetical protein
MKAFSYLAIITFFTFACDAPVRTRVPTSPDYNSISGQEFDNPSSYGSGGCSAGSSSGCGGSTTCSGGSCTNNDGGTSSTNTNEPGYENCDLSLQHYGGSLGYFGLCQHNSDERRFKAVFSQSSTSGSCFIPIHIQGDGTSFKLGIAECVHNNANTNYYMTLNKEMMPPTFSYPRPEQINGVMVIATNSVNSYMGCMNAKEDYFIATYGCCYQSVPYNGRYYCLQTNPACESAANNYANDICNSFVQNHGNNYRQVSF